MSVRLFKSLLFKSTQIQQEIEREQAKVRPDRWRLIKLKKLRLAIKDRMARLGRFANGTTNTQLQPAKIVMRNRRTPQSSVYQ